MIIFSEKTHKSPSAAQFRNSLKRKMGRKRIEKKWRDGSEWTQRNSKSARMRNRSQSEQSPEQRWAKGENKMTLRTMRIDISSAFVQMLMSGFQNAMTMNSQYVKYLCWGLLKDLESETRLRSKKDERWTSWALQWYIKHCQRIVEQDPVWIKIAKPVLACALYFFFLKLRSGPDPTKHDKKKRCRIFHQFTTSSLRI